MNTILNDLFESQTEKEDFQKLDKRISEECSRRLADYQAKLSPVDYETVRDAAFDVSAITKREAFQIGFKTAVRLILECRDNT